MMQKKALVIDTEATDKKDGILIELAWFDPYTNETFDSRFNPECPITMGAMATHHIIDAAVADKPSHTTATLPDGLQYVIGHNIDFDVDVLKRSGIDLSHTKKICTLALARAAFPELTSHSIGGLMYALSETQAEAREFLKAAHSAVADVTMTWFILKESAKKLGLGNSLMLLHLASEKARIVKKMPHGEHKDKPMDQVPIKYIQYALDKWTDCDKYLRTALEKAKADHDAKVQAHFEATHPNQSEI